MARACGDLIIGGFSGTSLPPSFSTRARRGELGGAILFARNVTDDPAQIASLNAEIARCRETPMITSVDQEGGRVARIKKNVAQLPAAMTLGARDDDAIEALARALGEGLAALGFSLDYAPVLDVHTNPDNPVIGDRAFSTEPERAARAAIAFSRGLRAAGVAPCGKHFPGHGDTIADSHKELPRVARDRARLDRVELVPFARAAREVPAMMSAHVVYAALDDKPATLSRRIATDLLRGAIGFRGVLISDDLEMRAIADTYGAGEAAVLAIDAGCDALLVCSKEDAQLEAYEALAKRAEKDATFRARCEEASARVVALRRAFPPKPLQGDALATALAAALARIA